MRRRYRQKRGLCRVRGIRHDELIDGLIVGGMCVFVSACDIFQFERQLRSGDGLETEIGRSLTLERNLLLWFGSPKVIYFISSTGSHVSVISSLLVGSKVFVYSHVTIST